MKKQNGLYYILSYVFFILPPFIWGLVELYREQNYDTVHITSLIINIIVYIILAGILAVLIYKKKLHIPTIEERKYLLFGLIGNIVIYFYTFQNLMNIDDIVTIYLVLMIILVVYYFLIRRKISPIELWILVPIFLVVDTLHILYTGCGYLSSYQCYSSTSTDVFTYMLYTIILFVPLGYYIHKIIELRPRDIFKYINIVIVISLSFMFQIEDLLFEELLGTLAIALLFFTILDFIVHIVNKTYNSKTAIYYLRIYTVLFITAYIGLEEEFFRGNANRGMLSIMVAITYVSFGINILSNILKLDLDKERLTKTIKFVTCTEVYKEQIKEVYGQVAFDHISLEDNAYSLLAIDGEEIVGFISSYIKPLEEPLPSINEAYINIIEVSKTYRKKGIASSLVKKTENHFKGKGLRQLRAWSSTDKDAAINLWQKLNYGLVPTTIHYSEDDIVTGYFVVKKL